MMASPTNTPEQRRYPARDRSGKTFEQTLELDIVQGSSGSKRKASSQAAPSKSVAHRHPGGLKEIFEGVKGLNSAPETWNAPSEGNQVVQESSVFGLVDLPAEVLHNIAQHINLETQVSLWRTNKQLHQALQGQVCYVKQFGMPDFSLPVYHERSDAELFALNGLDLLSDLPACFDPDTSHVAVLYEEEFGQSEVAAITFKQGSFVFKSITYPNTIYPSDSDIGSDFDDDQITYIDGHIGGFIGDRLLFTRVCDKLEAYKLLRNAPLGMDKPRLVSLMEVYSRVVLQSRPSASSEDLCCSAKYCYNMMCSRRWYRTVLYIVFGNSLSADKYCVRIERNADHKVDAEGENCWIAGDSWSVDYLECPADGNSGFGHPEPIKLDFAQFPEGVAYVQAYFQSSSDLKFQEPFHTQPLHLVTRCSRPQFDLFQQCLGFVYEANCDLVKLAKGMLEKGVAVDDVVPGLWGGHANVEPYYRALGYVM